MSDLETVHAQHQARLSLVYCAMYARERDNIIRRADAVGITKVEIARILGLNRTTISDIANAKPGDPQSTPEPQGAAQQPEDDT